MERAQAFAQRNNIRGAYGSYRKILEEEKPDCAYIAVTTNAHYELAVLCLEYGIPDDMYVPAPLEKKLFAGGLYAAYMILMDEIAGIGWNRLFDGWLKNHEIWDSNMSPSGENMNGLLEEHLDILHWRDKGHLEQVDLLLPIKRKEKYS